jgi:two-component system sensor histidine kinase TctE
MQIVDLDLLAQEVTREWVPRAQAKRIDIGYESRFPPANMEGNRMLLRECLNNLIDNAIRYTPEGGRVTTRVACSLDVVMLEVQDDGIGIDPPQCELVFERFYRVLGNENEGSGLGLAIVREIAHIHRGSVSIVMGGSERGTLLRAVFPRASAEVHTLRSVA